MPYTTARDLKEDVLFRASEPLTSADWGPRVIDYLNRAQRALAAGASEFVPEFVDDWWWMRRRGVLLLEPSYRTGTVSVSKGSISITFSDAPTVSVVGWRLRIPGFPDLPSIATHTGGQAAATLDAAYTGDTNTAATFILMKTTYSLPAAVQALSSPITTFRSPYRINGLSPEAFDGRYPLFDLSEGAPEAFCLEDETTLRFSHGGRSDGTQQRLEYLYRPVVTDLVDDPSSIPVVPLHWRHILADMALTQVFTDKNDERASAAALQARSGAAAMLKENRRRYVKLDQRTGQIIPRRARPAPLVTGAELIVG
jgi:hypothetical protein